MWRGAPILSGPSRRRWASRWSSIGKRRDLGGAVASGSLSSRSRHSQIHQELREAIGHNSIVIGSSFQLLEELNAVLLSGACPTLMHDLDQPIDQQPVVLKRVEDGSAPL